MKGQAGHMKIHKTQILQLLNVAACLEYAQLERMGIPTGRKMTVLGMTDAKTAI